MFCLCHVLPYSIKRNYTKSPHHIRSLRSLRFIKKSTFNVAGNLVIDRKIHVPKRIWYLSPKSKTRQCARSRGGTRAVFYPLIGLANIITKSLRHGNRFAAQVRRRYFSKGEKRRPEICLRFAGYPSWGCGFFLE